MQGQPHSPNRLNGRVGEINVRVETHRGSQRRRHSPDKLRKVYDNVHGFIYLPQHIWDFVDTPSFQRLRNIKQLGCLYYVFPGATHTRFEHSLGTAHLARKFLTALIKNHKKTKYEYDEQTEKFALLTVTLAGLLHDLGHGPYSHTFDRYIVQDIVVDEQKGEKWSHEWASEVLFDHLLLNIHKNQQLPEFVTPDLIPALQERVKELIRGDKGEIKSKIRPWQLQLISNQKNGIDVDKFDYFRRDAFYLGARNIYVDHDLLFEEARIIEDEICYPSKYVETVYNIFHSRYKLYKNYYFNVVSKGIQIMICDVLKETKGYFQLEQACRDIKTKQAKYIRLTDNIVEKVEDVLQLLPKTSNLFDPFTKAVQLIERIRKRDVYKFVKEFHYFISEVSDKKTMEQIEKYFHKNVIVEKVSSLSGIPKQDLCVSISNIGFGIEQANPLGQVGFFVKQEGQKNPTKSTLGSNSLSMLYTNAYIERSISLYLKRDIQKKFQLALGVFSEYCKDFNRNFRSQLQRQGNVVVMQGNVGETPQNRRAQVFQELIQQADVPNEPAPVL